MRNAAGIIARNHSAIKSINIIIKFNIEKKYELPCPCSKSLIRLFTKHQYWILFTCRWCLFILSPVQCFRAMQHSQLVVHKCFRVGLLFIVLSSSLICWLFYCQNLRNFRSMNFYLPKREMFSVDLKLTKRIHSVHHVTQFGCFRLYSNPNRLHFSFGKFQLHSRKTNDDASKTPVKPAFICTGTSIEHADACLAKKRLQSKFESQFGICCQPFIR